MITATTKWADQPEQQPTDKDFDGLLDAYNEEQEREKMLKQAYDGSQMGKEPNKYEKQYKETRDYWRPDEEPDYHLVALEAASKLPNSSVHDLLTNADTIEKWFHKKSAAE